MNQKRVLEILNAQSAAELNPKPVRIRLDADNMRILRDGERRIAKALSIPIWKARELILDEVMRAAIGGCNA